MLFESIVRFTFGIKDHCVAFDRLPRGFIFERTCPLYSFESHQGPAGLWSRRIEPVSLLRAQCVNGQKNETMAGGGLR
jgi:hypothetical protein